MLMFLVSVAAIAGGCCAAASIATSMQLLRRRRAALAGQSTEGFLIADLFAWRLRNGVPFCKGIVRSCLRIQRISKALDDAVHAANKRGVRTQVVELGSVLLTAGVFLGVLAAMLTTSIVAGIAVPACAFVAFAVVAGNERDKDAEASRDAVPEALESMAACFGSGLTLLQTMQQVASDVGGSLGDAFARSAHVLETGGSAQEALMDLRQGAHASELAFVAVALDVQHQSGGAMKQVLEAATDTVKGELSLRRSLRVQTAQARLSARVVAVMPLILVAAFSLVSPDFLHPFFESVLGYVLLGIAIAMQVAGVVLVRRALAVDGLA